MPVLLAVQPMPTCLVAQTVSLVLAFKSATMSHGGIISAAQAAPAILAALVRISTPTGRASQLFAIRHHICSKTTFCRSAKRAAASVDRGADAIPASTKRNSRGVGAGGSYTRLGQQSFFPAPRATHHSSPESPRVNAARRAPQHGPDCVRIYRAIASQGFDSGGGSGAESFSCTPRTAPNRCCGLHRLGRTHMVRPTGACRPLAPVCRRACLAGIFRAFEQRRTRMASERGRGREPRRAEQGRGQVEPGGYAGRGAYHAHMHYYRACGCIA
eukprot:300891-Chlamydomonas_euryale.AAC.1